ncbi:MAG TPA: SDR family oxidoreductase, partial [Bdellovibrionota bacterium]|nr:SDR family oxidoreductase [Bdellovibrionota bacterium]
AERRLWQSLQLHMDFGPFYNDLRTRIDIYRGDLTSENFGLDAATYRRLAKSCDSVIHCAASLNRKSEKACLNVNLRGTLQVIKLARSAQDDHGLRRFSDVSTVAVAGRRQDEVVTEDAALEWDRSDYDPYARTKKFCEYMVHELLPDVPRTIFRPGIVLGDSRFPETTQFDMVRAFVFLAELPVLPFRPEWRADIVPADYVGKAIVTIHQKEKPKYDIYHLSSGTASLTYRQIVDALRDQGHPNRHLFLSVLSKPFDRTVGALAAMPKAWGISQAASRMKVFLPYLTFNTIFENQRVKEELNEAPVLFSKYAFDLLQFAKRVRFSYPYRSWEEAEVKAEPLKAASHG